MLSSVLATIDPASPLLGIALVGSFLLWAVKPDRRERCRSAIRAAMRELFGDGSPPPPPPIGGDPSRKAPRSRPRPHDDHG